MQLWNILRQSRPFQYWRYACWSLAYTMWTFSRSEGPWAKQRTFFQLFERATLHTDPCRPQISFFFFSKVLFCAIFVPAFKKHSIVSRIACNAWPVCVYFAFILLWKINFPNEISKRNLGRLLCEKKIYSATIQILPNFVRFLNYIELFWEKVAFLFFQGREMSRVYIYIYINNHRRSGFVSNHRSFIATVLFRMVRNCRTTLIRQLQRLTVKIKSWQ